MSKDLIICGLDIGSSMIRTVIAQKRKDSDTLTVIGIGEVPSAGVRKGVLVNMEDALIAISASIKIAEQSCGHHIRSLYVSLSGEHITSRYSKGVISVSRADQEISQEDVSRVTLQAQSIGVLPNKEILHTITKEYVVDGEVGIFDPLGMRGVRLETTTLLIEGSTPITKNLTKCIDSLRVDTGGLVLSVIASSRAVLSKRQKELGVVSLDIGGWTSSIAVFEEGRIVHTAVLPVGAAHITNDIAIGLQIDIDLAEMIKLQHGVCQANTVNKKDIITISLPDTDQKISNISKKEVSEIIEARMDEIFDLVDVQLKKISKHMLFPAGVVLTGGGAKMPDIVDFAKNHLKLPVQVGSPTHIEGIIDHIASPEYATVVGLCLLGFDVANQKTLSGLFPFSGRVPSHAGEWARKFFKTFLP